MKKRGKILRDTNSGPGILVVDGEQHSFSLERSWKSAEPPRVGAIADVEFDEMGDVAAVAAVPESQLAREQAEAALLVARQHGSALASGAVARFGAPALVAAGLLLVSWFFLPAVVIQLPFGGDMHFTFWQLLGFLNAGNLLETLAERGSGSSGLYGLLAILSLAGPFAHHFWKDRRASLGGVLPLLMMLLVWARVSSALRGTFGGGSEGGFADFAAQARDEAMKAVSVGWGVYVALAVAIYFAAVGVRRYLAGRGGAGQDYDRPTSAIA